MKFSKYKTMSVIGLFSVLSIVNADVFLRTDNPVLDKDTSAKIFVRSQEAITGDVYVALEIDEQLFFLNAEDNSWELFAGQQLEPFTRVNDFSGGFQILTLKSTQFSNSGTYNLYQVVTERDASVFNSSTWLAPLSQLEVEVQLPEPEPVDNTGDTTNTVDGLPVPGSSRFGTQDNTYISGQYFTPKLVERALGNYTNAVNSFAEWQALTPEQQEVTLYWDNDLLLGFSNGKQAIFDNLRDYTFRPKNVKAGIVINESLTSGISTAYPGCVDLDDLNTHPRACGDSNPAVLMGTQVYSQRWHRLHNLDVLHDPIYSALSAAQLSNARYDLSAQIVVNNYMTAEQLANVPLFFEMSVSKVPGDFSNNACKVNSALQYSNGLIVSLTQKGFKTNLPEACQVDSTELQHYYVNVRAVNIDLDKNEINESHCDQSTGCKFELYAYLDSPCEYEFKNVAKENEVDDFQWVCK